MTTPIKYDLSKDEILYLIDQFVFSRRDRDMLTDRLIDGMTYDELSRKYYISVRQIKNIVHRNKDIIFSHADRLP